MAAPPSASGEHTPLGLAKKNAGNKAGVGIQ